MSPKAHRTSKKRVSLDHKDSRKGRTTINRKTISGRKIHTEAVNKEKTTKKTGADEACRSIANDRRSGPCRWLYGRSALQPPGGACARRLEDAATVGAGRAKGCDPQGHMVADFSR